VSRSSNADVIVSLSTSWNGARHDRPVDAIREIRSLGFEWTELYAHWVPASLSEIERALDGLGIKVSSLHAPCPMVVDDAGGRVEIGDWLAEVDEQRRRRAVDAHKRTIDDAAELGARGIVVHLGNSGAKNLQRQIFEAIRSHGAGSAEHRALLEEALAERRKAAGNGALEAAVKSASELGEHARGTSVGLGLECRDGFVEIPALDEYPVLFEACEGLPVYYWHDMGHGSKLENAGFVRARDYLRRFGDRLLGVHLHDTRLDHDHQAPGQADTDFTMLLPYLRPGTIRTLELSPRVEASHIRPGVDYLQQLGVL
jgi:sugar phosphate isomerase/epimerase